jgi:hypothetical protein
MMMQYKETGSKSKAGKKGLATLVTSGNQIRAGCQKFKKMLRDREEKKKASGWLFYMQIQTGITESTDAENSPLIE